MRTDRAWEFTELPFILLQGQVHPIDRLKIATSISLNFYALDLDSFLMEGGEKIRKPRKAHEITSSKMDEAPILPAEAFTHGGVRKTKFEPKIPTRRLKKLSAIKREAEDLADNALPGELQLLIKQSQEDAANRRGNRFDNKGSAPARVAFGFGSSTAGRAGSGSLGFYKGSGGGGGGGGGAGGGGGGGGGGWHGSEKKPSLRNIQGPEILDENSRKMRTPFSEPMDTSKYGPVTIPFRSAASPGILGDYYNDIGDADTFDEDAVPPAKELELMVEDLEERLLFFQIPSALPIFNMPSAATDGEGSSASKDTGGSIGATISLDKLPSGPVGKLLIYESGVVKLKIGDISLDALPGVQCAFAQELAAINSSSRHCCFLGDVTQRVVLTPDIDSLLHQQV
ncbi:hypothetical protein O6H91_13G057000 [Diphasiastrum complanatum]|uniref:Uncharacterized protein n=1 Tax=Diphasiastrum complanatum TaxID=34168 RepID=A0ACC2BV18_DIPCM|nr:hypothetical protein O6H91_13G057000 [Diphasiastrum complanatum]